MDNYFCYTNYINYEFNNFVINCFILLINLKLVSNFHYHFSNLSILVNFK